MNEDYIAKLRAELAKARTQYKRARARQRTAEVGMALSLSVQATRTHYYALQACHKWAGAIIRAQRSLALMRQEA